MKSSLNTAWIALFMLVGAAGCSTEPGSARAADDIESLSIVSDSEPSTPQSATDSLDARSDSAGSASSPSDPRAQQRRDAIGRRIADLGSGKIGQAASTYYNNHDNEPAWFDAGRPRDALDSLLEALSRANRQGLLSADYGVSGLTRQVDQARAQRDPVAADTLADLDVRLSLAFIEFARDLHQGRVESAELRPRWSNDLPSADYSGALARATRQGDVSDALSQLRPPHDGYTRLVQALSDYRAIVDAGGWPRIADGSLLEEGDRDARVASIRERLRLSGDLPPESTAGEQLGDRAPASGQAASDSASGQDGSRAPRYDAALADGIRAFQRRNGIKVDGKVGPETLKVLNISAESRVRQIELNLERWRWLPADLGARYIMVNIPDYRLQAFDDDRKALDMAVVVGESYEDRATPVFTDRMQYLIFRPFWNVPTSIAADEIVPEARKNPNHLAAERFEIVPAFGPDVDVLEPTPERLTAVEAGELFIRQRAGPSNALGLVKFMFPNEYAVYLHDSPAEQLFSRYQRDFSHGCVRVANPAALAEFVLNDRGQWDRSRIESALNGNERQRVDLNESIPVYLIYWTAFVDDSGVQFRPDLYEHDPRVDEAMRQTTRSAGASMGAS